MKFQVGQRVQIVANSKCLAAVGRRAVIVKAYACTDGSSTGLYKVCLHGHKIPLRGYAIDSDIQAVSKWQLTYVNDGELTYIVDENIRTVDNSFVHLAYLHAKAKTDLHDTWVRIYLRNIDTGAWSDEVVAYKYDASKQAFADVWPDIRKLIEEEFDHDYMQILQTVNQECSSFDISVNEDVKPGRQIVLRYDQVSSNGKLGYGLPAMSVRELIRLHDTIDAWLVEFRKRGTL